MYSTGVHCTARVGCDSSCQGDRKSLNFIGTDMMLMSVQWTNLVSTATHSHGQSEGGMLGNAREQL